MANSSLNLSSLDFDTLKQNFIEFLKTQSAFKDYDFSGSNINVLLDVMAYNSYLNAFYLNMVGSEMFLDTAQKYDSVISHAKELNYVPRSYRSSVANVNIVFSAPTLSSLTIPKETKFIGVNSNGSYVFTTSEAKILTSSNSTFTVNDLQIYEGDYYQDSYVVNYDIEGQQFIISNKNVDTNSITVNVIENNGANNIQFTKVDTLFGLNALSETFFLQATHNGQYEVTFGDGLFGRKPLNSSTVIVRYRVASGIEADGVTQYALFDDLKLVNGGDVNVTNLTVSSNSSSAAVQESLESIRFAAPRYFATQQRAVSNDDYASLVLSNFGGEISDVVVYGGQEVEPKLYGRVIISLKPSNGVIAPDYIKSKISNYLLDYIALPNRVLITDPEYTYCYVKSSVQYDPTATSKTIPDIKTDVLNSITNYSSVNLEKFGNDLRYSRLVTDIDNADVSITSNDTELRIIKRITPKINTKTTYNIEVGNVLYYDATVTSDNAQHTLLHANELDTRISHATLISSTFTYNSTDGNVYPLSFFEDDAQGNIKVYTTIASEIVSVDNVGTVDYSTGTIKLNNISIADYSPYISLYIRSRFKDIFASQNKIILIDPNDVNIEVIETVR